MLDILWPSEHVGNHRKCNLNVAGALVNAPNIVIQSRQPPSCTISISRWAHYLHNEISCRCRSKQLFVFKYARNTPRGEKHKLFYNFCLQICKKHSKRRETQNPSSFATFLFKYAYQTHQEERNTNSKLWCLSLVGNADQMLAPITLPCSTFTCVLPLPFLLQHYCTILCFTIAVFAQTFLHSEMLTYAPYFLLQTYRRRLA